VNLEARYGRVALNGAAATILLSLLALSVLAWIRTADLTMGLMPMMTVDAASFVIFASTWAVMMAAMMFPSVAPVVLVYSQYARRVATSAWPARTALFVGGYFLVWAGVGMIAYFVAIAAASLVETVPVLAEHPNVALGLAFIAGGLYQLSPLKDRCLGHCRSPLHWILRGFAPGAGGAIRMGITEGVFCLGCCVGLMVVLLAVGMSSLAWMGAIAAVIFVEKVIAPTPRVSRLVALGLLAIGVFIAVAPTGAVAPAMSAALR
jgi:predicted metal-binding membrane protein